ncbi:hypothetical protein [Methylosinus sporium]|uniref:hypothetical protein n=1 Tax=Methylosinus sporium TaxID=428 RepID=UPI00383A91B3
MRFRSIAIFICALGLSAILVRQGFILLEAEQVVDSFDKQMEAKAHSEPEASHQRADEELLAELAAFRDMDGVATRLLDLRATLLGNSGDDDRFSSGLVDLLDRVPTSGKAWMELAKFRWRQGAPLERTLETLEMSKVTAPHEARIIESRILFLSAIWEFLPPEGKRSVVSQLIELNGRIDERIRRRLAIVLGAKPEATREAIVNDLRMRGAAGSACVRAIGLGL